MLFYFLRMNLIGKLTVEDVFIVFNAAFTLSSFDNQERKLMFLKTAFQVLKPKFYACSMKQAFYLLHRQNIVWAWQQESTFIQAFHSVSGCQTCMCKCGINLLHADSILYYCSDLSSNALWQVQIQQIFGIVMLYAFNCIATCCTFSLHSTLCTVIVELCKQSIFSILHVTKAFTLFSIIVSVQSIAAAVMTSTVYV